MHSVHMALLPGDGNPWHSRIVIWGEHDAPDGAELGWNPGIAGCGAWPYPNLAIVPGSSWSPPADIFCAGHAQLATGPGLLTAGGDEVGIHWGIPDALAFTPGSGTSPGTWSVQSDMHQARFYPTVTAIRDGRMVVTGGLRHGQTWHLGGRVNGMPPTGGAGDLLHRLGQGTKRLWDPPVTPVAVPSSNRPSPREGHTAANFSYAAGDLRQAIFGGKDFGGVTTDRSVYLLRREYGAPLDNDYKYEWLKLEVSSQLPPARSDHVAIDLGGSPDTMLIYGGLSNPGSGPAVVLDDLWKFSKSGSQWRWDQISASGTSPGPRYGHAAVKDGTKMYVFGGSATPNGVPTDNQVYKLTLPNGPWEIVPVTGTPPEPRRDHTMVLAGTSLLIYGGYTQTAPSSSALSRLDLAASTPAWSTIATDGPSPGPRAGHTARFDNSTGAPRLTLFGGDPPRRGDPAVDNRIYTINPFPASGSATWTQGPAAAYRLSGHTVGGDPLPGRPLHGHLPEVYNPSDDAWTPQTGSGWFPPGPVSGDYPIQFLVPGTSIPGGGGRVLRVGPDLVSRYLDVPAAGLSGSWQPVPNGNNGTLNPLTGVQYEPGKIMVMCNAPGGGGAGDDRARTFNALAMGTSTWVDRAGMQARHDPDVMVLPNGKVLVVGDTNCPQMWNPSDSSWTGYNPCGLAVDPGNRGYHATAMVLPDARVLTGSGNASELLVYCPPYLFNPDNSLATRPTINSAPTSLVYGEPFVIGKPAADQIASACFIRPAAVTHSFDQNGRFIPLAFQAVSDTVLQAWAPTSGSVAPPGDYLLFILNTQGVPAIARWVHLGDCAQVPCDTDSPPKVTDMYADIVAPNEVWMVWYAPGDDTTPLSGSYDLRLSTTGLANEQAYAVATTISGEPAVQPLGTPINTTVDSLSECTQYHFALKTRDGSGPLFKNWSLLGNTITVTTTCGGGPSGGSRAERVDEGRVAGGASATPTTSTQSGLTSGETVGSGINAPSAGLAAASALDTGAGVLEAETRRTREGGWQVMLRRVSQTQGVDGADLDAIVSQVRDEAGNWRTLGRYRPAPGKYPLGLCALRDQGRVVFPTGYGVDRVAPGFRSRGQECAMSGAQHSRTGAMTSMFLAEGGAVEMAVGDVLTLTYDHTGERPADEIGWYLQVHATGLTAAPSSATGRRLGERVPTRFALHQNQPNPFGRSTTIGFDLPVASPAKLEVFDLLGRRVATLAEGEYPAGSHAVEWDLRGTGGVPVRAGVYLYRLKAKEFRAQRKLSVVP